MIEPTHDDVDVASLLVDVLPQGLLVVDRLGTVFRANERAATMTGYPVDVLVGRTVLDFVYEEDLEFLVQSLDHASDYPGAVMGPVRIRYRRSTGEIQWTECWAYECPPESGIVDGYVITMSTESVLDNLSKAVRDVASGAPLRVALQSVARAVHASPIEASAPSTSAVRARPSGLATDPAARARWTRKPRKGVACSTAASSAAGSVRARSAGSLFCGGLR